MARRKESKEGFPIHEFFSEVDYSESLQAHKIVACKPVISLPQILVARHPNSYPVYTILVKSSQRKMVNIFTGNQCPPTRAFWKPHQKIEETKFESLISWQMKLSNWIEINDTQRYDTLTFGPFRTVDWRIMLDSKYPVQSSAQNPFPTLQEIRQNAFNFKNNPSFEKFLESVFKKSKT